MPPQWNAYDDIPDPPLVADRSPLDDLLAQDAVPTPPAQPQAIPSDLLTLGDVPEPPPAPVALPSEDDGIPEPPSATVAPEPVADLYKIPEPPAVAPEELAPDFAATDYARAQDRLEAPLSVDVAGAAQAAQTAERNYATLGTELAKVQDEVIGLSRRRGELAGQAQTIDQRIAELKGTKKRTPEQEAELKASTEQRKGIGDSLRATESEIATGMERFGMAQQQVSAARESYEAARAKADMDFAAGQREAEIRGAAAQEAGTQYFIAESKKLDREYRAKTDKLTTEANAARARMDEDRKAYRDALKAGPAKQSVVLTVAAVIGEALAARRTGREPDFGRVIGGLEAATKAQFDDRVKRQLDLIAEGEDSLAKAAQERRILEAEKAARKAEILAGIEADIQSKMGAARGTLQEAQLSTVYSDVRRERERQEAIAMDARSKQAQADETARLDMEKKKAEIAKLQAEAAEKERKAMGGGGAGKRATPGTLDPYSVFIPGGDEPIAAFPRTGDGEKKARAANEAIIANDDVLRGLNEIEGWIEDYGSANAGDYTEFTKSDQFRRLETAIAFMEPSLAKVSSGGFSATDTDTKWAQGVLAAPKAWTGGKDAALAKLREAKRQIEERYRNGLKKAGLAEATRERIVSARREQSISQADVAKAEFAAAPKVLADPKADPKRKLAAIPNLIEQQKQQAPDDGAWVLPSIQILKNAQNATDDPDVEARLAEEIARLRKIHMGKGEAIRSGPQTEADLPDEAEYLRQQYGGLPSLNPGAK